MQKKIFLVVALLCHLLSNGFAQNQYPDAETQLSDMLSLLDMGTITNNTGILADRMPRYADMGLLRGKYLSDSTRLSLEPYELLYGQLRQAYIIPTVLPAADSLVRLIKGVKLSPVVHLSLSAFKYQRLKPYALSNGLITYDGQRFQDVVDPRESPYMMDTLVISTANKPSYDTTTVPFILKDNFTFTNLNISTIQVDFGNGSGYQTIAYNQLQYITYPDTGQYAINVKVTLATNEVLLSGAYIEIVEPIANNVRSEHIVESRMTGTYNSSPDGYLHIGTTTVLPFPFPQNPIPATGVEIFYWYNMNECMDSKIRKPLIIIEGFDPLNKYGSSGVIDKNTSNPIGLLDKDYDLNKPLKDLINEQNYDLFYINFVDSKISIIDNAAFVKQAIEWINAQKHLNGSNEKNIVIGASMGGLVGKWALREFELNNQDHEAELFISFDSPMRGANIPLALQALPLALGKRKILGVLELNDVNGVLETGLNTITSKAARQMMYYYLGDCKDGCTPAALSVEHDEFYNALDARGELTVPYVAMSNGALDGTGMMFGAGAELINASQIDWWIKAIEHVLLGIFSLDVEVKGWALPGKILNSSLNKIAVHTFEFPSFLGIPLVSSSETITLANSGYITYDNAPGGLRTFDEVEGEKVSNKVGWNFKSFCFIPTISSLDLRNVTNPFASGLTNIAGTIASSASQVRAYQGSTTSSTQYEEFQKNQQHVTFNNTLATFLLGNIIKYELNVSVLNNRTYNFGISNYSNTYPNGTILSTSHIIKKNITISNTGKLWINRDDKIDFTDIASNPPNNNPKFFDVLLGTDFCTAAPTTVTITNGGQIYIGHQAVKNTGSLVIPDRTKLVIDNGGIVTIDDLSNIIVLKGGTIEIKAGGRLLIKGDGRLTIDKEGTLLIHDGADIELEKAMTSPTLVQEPVGSIINLQGRLFLVEGRIVLKGNGFMRIGENHEIKSGTGFVTFEALDRNHVGYRVDKSISLNLYDLNIKNTQFYLNEHIHFFSKSFDIRGAKLKAEVGQITTSDDKVFPFGGGNFIAKNALTSSINNTIIEDVSIIVDGINGGSQAGLFINTVTSTTKRREYNLRVSNVPVVSMSWNSFSTTPPDLIPFATIYPISKIGAKLENVGRCKIVNNIFQDFKVENGVDNKSNAGVQSEFAGIYCENSPALTITENSLVNNCKHGILSKEAVNIVMDHSTISSCIFGIKMYGNVSSGLVKMMCSSLIENQIGINGIDITLAIDGIINQQNSTMIPQNIFIATTGTNRHFSIQYIKKNETSILARRNYWENPLRYFFKNESGQNVTLDQSLPGDGSCGGINFTNCTEASPVFPITQSGIPQEYYNGFCINTNTCSGYPIMEKYWRGYNCLINGDIEDAIAHFRPLAEESYGAMNFGQNSYCPYMLKEARAWVAGYDQYIGTAIQFVFDSTACLLKWSTPQATANYSLQKKNNNGWTTVTSATNPYPINNNNNGTYRMHVTKNNCPYFDSDEVLALCDTLCIDLIRAVLNDTLITCTTFLPQTLNFNIKIDMRFYEQSDPIEYTITFPIVGTAGNNTNIIDVFAQYPYNLGYLMHWTVYIQCATCNQSCVSDSIVIMLPPLREFVSTKDDKTKVIKVYPNPFSNVVNIDLPNGNYAINIFDVNGKLLKEMQYDGANFVIDNSAIINGVYLLSIKDRNSGVLIYKSTLIKIN
jgi:hypothetical protein